MEITHKQLRELLVRGFNTKVPIDIKGKPGIGKSELIEHTARKIAKDCGRTFVFWNKISESKKEKLLTDVDSSFIFADLRLSQFDQTDLKGFPAAKEDHAKWVPNLLFKVLSNPDAEGLIFFDELNLAPPSVVASCYQIVNDHVVGETPISRNVYFVSAGNSTADTNNAFDDPAPLNNRRMNVELLPPRVFSTDGDDWTSWAAENNVDSRIISFLHFKDSMLFKFDNNSKDPSFPTPRMWAKSSSLIQGVTDEKVLKLYVSACVGQAAAIEMVAFTKLSQTINVQQILKKPELVRKYVEGRNLDILSSLVGQIAEMYNKDEVELNTVLPLCYKENLSPEFSMYLLRLMKAYDVAKGKDFGKEIMVCKNYSGLYEELFKYLR